MSMSKKDFIALADTLKKVRASYGKNWDPNLFRACDDHVNALADFCQSQNSAFMRGRWLAYIAGECGPSGGAHVKVRVGQCKVCRHYGEDCTGTGTGKQATQ